MFKAATKRGNQYQLLTADVILMECHLRLLNINFILMESLVKQLNLLTCRYLPTVKLSVKWMKFKAN